MHTLQPSRQALVLQESQTRYGMSKRAPPDSLPVYLCLTHPQHHLSNRGSCHFNCLLLYRLNLVFHTPKSPPYTPMEACVKTVMRHNVLCFHSNPWRCCTDFHTVCYLNVVEAVWELNQTFKHRFYR